MPAQENIPIPEAELKQMIQDSQTESVPIPKAELDKMIEEIKAMPNITGETPMEELRNLVEQLLENTDWSRSPLVD